MIMILQLNPVSVRVAISDISDLISYYKKCLMHCHAYDPKVPGSGPHAEGHDVLSDFLTNC
jgi:hypothetical protein